MSRKIRTSRLRELHESKFRFVSRVEFIRSKLANFSAHVSGVYIAFQLRYLWWDVKDNRKLCFGMVRFPYWSEKMLAGTHYSAVPNFGVVSLDEHYCYSLRASLMQQIGSGGALCVDYDN